MHEDVPRGTVPRLCEQCSRPFFQPIRFAKPGHGRFCSTDCLRIWRKTRPKEPRTCPKCFETFYREPHRRDVCCSPKCANAYRQRPLTERFWEKVDFNGPVPLHCPELGPCWLWMAGKHPFGYGKITIDGKPRDAHRVAWELVCGAIAEGLSVLHRCDVPGCVRPAHLFIGTTGDNVRDAVQKGRVVTGDRHHARARPEVLSRGAAHSALCNPPRGADHPWHKRPELIRRGEANDASKLTDEQVRDIRARRAAGERGVDLAAEFGVSQATISNVAQGKVWRHLL